MNAAHWVKGDSLWSPRRDEAYIGVLIDDLVTLGTQEPYRMFTSRAEYRLLLREDNADLRLSEIGRDLGLVTEARWRAFSEKREGVESALRQLNHTWVRVGHNRALENALEKPLQHDTKASDVLKRPEMTYQNLAVVESLGLPSLPKEIAQQVEIQTKYQGYISRQQEDIEKLRKFEATKIPPNFNFKNVKGLSAEVVQKLERIKPESIAQAGRISGVTPAALSLLLIHLKKKRMLA